MKICSKCKQEKSLPAFNDKKTGKFGKQAYCKLCQKEVRNNSINFASCFGHTVPNKILNTDSMIYLNNTDDKSVDMVLTDVPYVISKDTGFKTGGTVDRLKISMDFGQWDKDFTFDNLSDNIKEYYRVLKTGGYIIIFYDLWKIQELADLLTTHGFKQLRFIEWVKTNPVPINSKTNYLTNSREVAICAVKGSKPIFNSQYDNGIYSYPIYHSKDRFHPTQKPVKMFEELIKKHTNKNDIVLDTFQGSGTTAIACINTSRQYMGCEKDKKYHNKLINRLKTSINYDEW